MSKKLIIEKINLKKIKKHEFSFIREALPRLNLKRFSWEYVNNYYNGYSFVARIGKTILAHNSFIICKFIVNNKKVLVAKSEGSYAKPELINNFKLKNKRIFREVVKKALIQMRKENIFLAYGFPNNLGHKSYIYGGYNLSNIDVFTSNLIINFDYLFTRKKSLYFFFNPFLKVINLIWKQLLLKPLLFFRLKNKLKNIKKIKSSHLMDIENLFQEEYKKYPDNYMMVVRDYKYIKWRYVDNPYHKYYIFGCYSNKKLRGFIIFNILNFETHKNLEIKDILFQDNETLDSLLLFTFDWSLKNKISIATLWEDKIFMKKSNAATLVRNGFFRIRILNKKVFIQCKLKNSKKSVNLELKKYLERT